MRFAFKSQLQDFIVDELLDFVPDNKGPFHYFRIEKKGINTMDIIDHLCAHSSLTRKEIGIAGLKDKKWITRQRICLHKNDIAALWWVATFKKLLWLQVTILKEEIHSTPLRVWSNSGNAFTVTLRAKKPLSAEQKKLLEKNITTIRNYGFPNCFGVQRFGKWLRNYKRAAAIFEWNDSKSLEDYSLKFMLQAYASMHFNNYTLARWDAQDWLLNGDICVDKYHAYDIRTSIYRDWQHYPFDYKACKDEHTDDPFLSPDHISPKSDKQTKRIATWPMLWWNILLPPKHSESWFCEWETYKQTNFWDRWSAISRSYGIFGFRRPLWVRPWKFRHTWDTSWNLILDFSLPTWAYATVLLGILLENIDPKGVVENRLVIPHTI